MYIHDLWMVFLSDQLRLKDHNPLLVQTIMKKLSQKWKLTLFTAQKWQEWTADLHDGKNNTLLYACGYLMYKVC